MTPEEEAGTIGACKMKRRSANSLRSIKSMTIRLIPEIAGSADIRTPKSYPETHKLSWTKFRPGPRPANSRIPSLSPPPPPADRTKLGPVFIPGSRYLN